MRLVVWKHLECLSKVGKSYLPFTSNQSAQYFKDVVML